MTEILENGGVILWIIRALSAVSASIVIERLIHFRKLRGEDDQPGDRAARRRGGLRSLSSSGSNAEALFDSVGGLIIAMPRSFKEVSQ